MRIKVIHSQQHLDFTATLECEHCGYEQYTEAGYDDNYFHAVIVPKIYCRECNKKAPEDYVPHKTK